MPPSEWRAREGDGGWWIVEERTFGRGKWGTWVRVATAFGPHRADVVRAALEAGR